MSVHDDAPPWDSLEDRYTLTRNAAPGEGRVLVFNFDGTWNDPTDAEDGPDRDTTNVHRFHTMVETTDTQRSFYFAGVGNQVDHNKFMQMMGGVFGAGADDIVKAAMVTLMKEYQPNDELVLTGFSRGAAIARMFAMKLYKEGLPEQMTVETCQDGEMNIEACSKQSVQPKIRMLGCFDTVASFGIPRNFMGIPFQRINLFKDFSISPLVERAYHAVAKDETRGTFDITLMNREPRVSEVWFSGSHSDVGGGFRARGLADITLKWMMNHARDHGVSFTPEAQQVLDYEASGQETLHTPEKSWIFGSKTRDQGVLINNSLHTGIPPDFHESVHLRVAQQVDYHLQDDKQVAEARFRDRFRRPENDSSFTV